MKNKLLYFIFTGFLTTQTSYSQVGINTDNPQSTLDVVASLATTSKDGILPPRVTKQQLAAKNSGTYNTNQEGAIVYVTTADIPTGVTPSLSQVTNITSSGYYYFNGTEWSPYLSKNIYNSDGSLTGNRIVTQGNHTLAYTSSVANGFSVDGPTFSVDAANHKIGIGTTTPETKLHVVSTDPKLSRYNLIDANSGSNQYGIMALRNISELAIGNLSLLGFTNNGPTAGGANWALGSIRTGISDTKGLEEDFYIGNSNGGNLIERMRISASGNIGIGTSSPNNKLHIKGSSNIDPVRIEGLQSGDITVTGSKMLMIDGNNNVKTTTITPVGVTNGLSKTAAGDIKLGGTLTEATTITTDGTNTLKLAGLTTGNASNIGSKILIVDSNNNVQVTDKIANDLSIPSPAIFTLLTAQTNFLDNTAAGAKKTVPMSLTKNAIKGLTFDASSETITFPPGIYQITFIYEAFVGGSCTVSSYLVDFPKEVGTQRIHSTASHKADASGLGTNHGGTISYVTTLANTTSWVIQLGRGSSGNCSNGMTLVQNSTQLVVFKLGDI